METGPPRNSDRNLVFPLRIWSSLHTSLSLHRGLSLREPRPIRSNIDRRTDRVTRTGLYRARLYPEYASSNKLRIQEKPEPSWQESPPSYLQLPSFIPRTGRKSKHGRINQLPSSASKDFYSSRNLHHSRCSILLLCRTVLNHGQQQGDSRPNVCHPSFHGRLHPRPDVTRNAIK